MGIQDIKAAFNEAGRGRLTCTRARMRYEGSAQVLEFDGTRSDGEPFAIVTDPIPATANILAAAREATNKEAI